MLSLEYMKEHIKDIEQDKFLDTRWTTRMMQFMPYEELEKYGYKLSEDFDPSTYEPKEWTEENLMAQLEEDVDFAIEKATNHRGISASLMNNVLKSWCIVLENGLENTKYGWYGDKLIKALNEKYNLGYNTDKIFDEEFYKEW